jgi:hypothetical protein
VVLPRGFATGPSANLTNPYRSVTRCLGGRRRLLGESPPESWCCRMRRTVTARRALPGERYRSLARFYTADDRRIHSREQDVGLWWREAAEGPLHRAAWVSDTGELYLVRLGPEADGGGTVEVLATVEDPARLESALEGWRERCGEEHSLGWLRERAALRLRGSGDSAAGRPRESAPTARSSRRTAGIGGGYQDRGRALPA